MPNLLYVLGYFLLLLYLPKNAEGMLLKASPLIFLIFFYGYITLYQKRSPFAFRKGYTHIYLTSGLLIIGLFRTNKPDVDVMGTLVKVLLFGLFVVCTIKYTEWYVTRHKSYLKLLIVAIVMPYVLYGLANYALWTIGFKVGTYEETTIGQAVMLSQFGMTMDRVKFPLATGFNSFASLLGGLLTISLLMGLFAKRYRLLSLVSSLLFGIMLLLIDSRSALLYPLVVGLVVFLIRKRQSIHVTKHLVWLQFAAPFLLILTLQGLADWVGVQSVARSAEELHTGNSRVLIWGIALSKIATMNPVYLIGYGEYGHFASGASLLWAPFFSRFDAAELMHPHNTLLMILFDYGLVGLAGFCFLLYRVFHLLSMTWSTHRTFSLVVLGYLLYFLLLSITESFFGFYYLNTSYLLFSVVIIQAVVAEQVATRTPTKSKRIVSQDALSIV